MIQQVIRLKTKHAHDLLPIHGRKLFVNSIDRIDVTANVEGKRFGLFAHRALRIIEKEKLVGVKLHGFLVWLDEASQKI